MGELGQPSMRRRLSESPRQPPGNQELVWESWCGESSATPGNQELVWESWCGENWYGRVLGKPRQPGTGVGELVWREMVWES